jgi:hypothetical protein
MASPGAPRNGAKERSWRRLIQQWRHSGMTIRDFCVEHEVSEPSFFAWRRTIADRDRQSGHPSADGYGNVDSNKTQVSPTFVPLHVVSTPVVSTPAVSTPAGAAYEVVLRDGCIVRVPAGFDPATLRQLLVLLNEERPC